MFCEKTKHRLKDPVSLIFFAWTFVLLCRPQDIFPFLAPLRPALVMGLLTLTVVFLSGRRANSFPFFKERQVKLYVALLVVMILSIPFSIYARLSFMTIFTQYINNVLFFFVFYKVVNSVPKLNLLLLLGCFGNGLYLLSALVDGNFSEGRLFFGGMFDPNDLAFFALSFIPLNLLFIFRENPLWVRLGCFGAFGVGVLLILMTGSRGGFLALVVVVAMLLFGKWQTIRFPMKLAFLAICLTIVSFSQINSERFMTLLDIQEDYNVHGKGGRVAIWEFGGRLMLENPVTGVGVGCFAAAVGRDREHRGAVILAWQTAHNSLVQIGGGDWHHRLGFIFVC